jgi:hypothetical protein
VPDICVTSLGKSSCQAPTYAEQSLTTTAFVEVCSVGTHVTVKGARDGSHSAQELSLPFTFAFWGSTSASGVWPTTSGALVFGNEPTSDDGVGWGYLPTDSFGPVAAPFWDQLRLGDAPTSDICYATIGTAPDRQFVVEWAHVGRVGRTVDLTFEVVLHETSNVIDLVYGQLSQASASDASWADGSRAGIGLQSGQNGVAVRHTGAVPAGAALRYSPL